jgi:hypothetical protein
MQYGSAFRCVSQHVLGLPAPPTRHFSAHRSPESADTGLVTTWCAASGAFGCWLARWHWAVIAVLVSSCTT